MKSFQMKALVVAITMALPSYAQQVQQVPSEAKNSNAASQENANIQQDSSEAELEIIEVTGVRQADIKARDLEREKNGLSSVIATDDIGNFVDQNVAESLRRLPGVTLQRSEGEGKFVSVRGLGPGFVAVSINGSEMSGVGDERKVGLDAIPSDILGSIEVLKTLTADQDLNSIGGAVNVNAISAYDRGKAGLKFKAQDAYSTLRDKHSPKFSLDGTEFFLDKTIGIGFALSHENRKSQVDEVRHHSTNDMSFYQADTGFTANENATVAEQIAAGPEILAPNQLEYRREIAGRTRKAASLNVEFKPNDTSYYYVRGNVTQFTDSDVALREFYDFQDAGPIGDGEILYVNGDTKEFILSDIDVYHQYFIQGGDNTTKSFSLGGENKIGESWTIDYELAQSSSYEESNNDRRVQFRERDLVVYGKGSKDNIQAQVVSPEYAAQLGGFDPALIGTSGTGDASTMANWDFDNLFLEDGTRDDKIKSGKLNLTNDFFYKHLSYIKAGVAFSQREYIRDKNRASYIPSAADCGGDATCISVIGAPHSDYPSSIPADSNFQYPFVDQDQVDYIVDSSKITRESATQGELSIDSTKEDYTLTEDTKAAYVMAEMPINDDLIMIAGVRFVETEFSSTGFLSLENDDFEFNGAGLGSLDIAIPLPEASIKYSEYFPSVHLRYEPNSDILVRGAIWTSFTRPSFSQARAFAKFDEDIELCPPQSANCADDQGSANVQQLQDYILGSNNTIDVGNPNLLAMTSINYDASIGWYPSKDLFMEASIFYKDIDNFIVDVNGITMNIEDLPLTLPVNQITEFVIPQNLILNDVNITLNGNKATVLGLELSYNQFFESGFFVQSNMTLLDSEAELDPSIRADKVPLPDQADTTFNLTLGWEDADYSVRIIGNHRAKILEEVGACPVGVSVSNARACKLWSDRYQDAVQSVDFKAKMNINKQLSVYFDAINLTDEVDLRYFEGNEQSGGNILYQREEYGRTFQLGLNYKFY
ncbi:TonB-dependent receptor [Paraglaciecola hydrolytica]|uniref:TonB-dependent receptor n=1 Tax=Paraglaciecola hydrolytica TaxID=1799789 RepID=A0A136A1H9_9ALTE|nr:TonB-dependent receptor [Paraglaciecola hydrolytica]KXI29081.1 TonB-dependent receptor [Paraglaciecola hydrolytica]